MIDQKEAAELVVLDELQLFLEPAHCLGVIDGAERVAFDQSGETQVGQRLRSGRAFGAAEVGEGVTEVARDIERLAALGDGQRRGDSIRTVIEQRNDFVQWPQVKFAVRISN